MCIAAAQQLDDPVAAGAGPERRAQVDLVVAEEAQPQPAVGREPHPVAGLAVVVRQSGVITPNDPAAPANA